MYTNMFFWVLSGVILNTTEKIRPLPSDALDVPQPVQIPLDSFNDSSPESLVVPQPSRQCTVLLDASDRQLLNLEDPDLAEREFLDGDLFWKDDYRR